MPRANLGLVGEFADEAVGGRFECRAIQAVRGVADRFARQDPHGTDLNARRVQTPRRCDERYGADAGEWVEDSCWVDFIDASFDQSAGESLLVFEPAKPWGRLVVLVGHDSASECRIDGQAVCEALVQGDSGIARAVVRGRAGRRTLTGLICRRQSKCVLSCHHLPCLSRGVSLRSVVYPLS